MAYINSTNTPQVHPVPMFEFYAFVYEIICYIVLALFVAVKRRSATPVKIKWRVIIPSWKYANNFGSLQRHCCLNGIKVYTTNEYSNRVRKNIDRFACQIGKTYYVNIWQLYCVGTIIVLETKKYWDDLGIHAISLHNMVTDVPTTATFIVGNEETGVNFKSLTGLDYMAVYIPQANIVSRRGGEKGKTSFNMTFTVIQALFFLKGAAHSANVMSFAQRSKLKLSCM